MRFVERINMEGDNIVKKTMTRIMLLAAAMVLALSLCFVANAEEVTETAGTPAYIFWQDTDWWPAA